jgi:ATP-binding cassette subfamily B protein
LVPLVVLDVVGAGAALAFPAALGRAIDLTVRASRVGAGAGGPSAPSAQGAILLATLLVTVAVAVDVATQLVAGRGTAEATGRLRRDLVAHVLSVGPRLVERTPPGDLVARLVGSTATAAKTVVVVAGMAAAVLPPAGAVIALTLIDPWLAVTFVVGMLSVSGVVRTYLTSAQAATAGYLEAQGAIAARLVDALTGARTIAAARTTEREVARILTPLDALRAQGVAVWHNIARLAFRGEPVVLLTQVAVIAVAGVRLASGDLSAGELLAASRYAVMAAGIGGMVDQLATLTRARAAAARLTEVYNEPAPAYGDAWLPHGPGELVLRGISAGPIDAPVLDGLDLTVPGGRVVALVGRSGAGKSLLAAVVGRLAEPTAGEVLLDGVPVDRLPRATLRRAFGYAFARPALWQASVIDALRFGADPPSLDRLGAACSAAHVDAFVAKLPDGYAASLAGTPLSGGEVQRLGLARALAHDARVLVLDDATSSLDTATEAQVVTALTTGMPGRTRLLVTHRRATAARADLVAWLDGGRIRAFGPHRALWTDPAYRAVFRPEPEPASESEADTDTDTADPSPPAGPAAASGSDRTRARTADLVAIGPHAIDGSEP